MFKVFKPKTNRMHKIIPQIDVPHDQVLTANDSFAH